MYPPLWEFLRYAAANPRPFGHRSVEPLFTACLQPKPDDDRWTGAEIRQCCEEAALQGIPIVEAAQYVIPVAVSGAAENEAMRQQAAGKYLDACRGGTFSLSAQRPAAERRAIRRPVADPSQN
jgi:hypothetical protein